MPLTKAFAQLVPTRAALGIIVGLVAGGYMAGIGSIALFGSYRELPGDVELLWVRTNANTTAIVGMQREIVARNLLVDRALEAATNDRRRILCLAGVAATGEVVLATQIDERCP